MKTTQQCDNYLTLHHTGPARTSTLPTFVYHWANEPNFTTTLKYVLKNNNFFFNCVEKEKAETLKAWFILRSYWGKGNKYCIFAIKIVSLYCSTQQAHKGVIVQFQVESNIMSDNTKQFNGWITASQI